jgi:hypothetical protein
VAALRPHPLLQPLPRVADAVDAGEQLRHERLFDRAVAEVGVIASAKAPALSTRMRSSLSGCSMRSS